MLRGRREECEALDRLLDDIRAGRSRALVLRGSPGVGKSALLEYLTHEAGDCRVVRATGVYAEMELPFAGLHQLCAPLLGSLGGLPAPQEDALAIGFGLRTGAPPDRLLVGLAALSLFSEVAAERPLLCVVDDVQWLDRASAEAIAFAARRLAAESVGVLFATRAPNLDVLAGLPVLMVDGLRHSDAHALLSSRLHGPVDGRIRDRIVAETRGNPLALLELPRGLVPAELAGGFGLPSALAVHERIEHSYQRRLDALPPDTQELLLIAAIEPLGEPRSVLAAAERLGIGPDAAIAAGQDGLLDLGPRLRFSHPLVRSAVYRAASPERLRAAHAALAAVTDPATAPDQRAWHLAHATSGPDERVAEELTRSAERARARGGVAAAAAFLERAALLTPDPVRRAQRAFAAASAKHLAGDSAAAEWLLATIDLQPLDDRRQARVGLLQAQIAFATGDDAEAALRLLRAAERIEPFAVADARHAYLDALAAAMFLPRRGSDEAALSAIAASARRAPPAADAPRGTDLLLDGLALAVTDGLGAGVASLGRAVQACRREASADDEATRRGWYACRVAQMIWDDDSWLVLSARQLELARGAGALGVLPIALNLRLALHVLAGELEAAAALAAEIEAVTEVTSVRLPPYGAAMVAAWGGREREAKALIDAGLGAAAATDGGPALAIVQNLTGVLYNGLGRFEAVLECVEDSSTSGWALVELIEAAARSGRPERAGAALRRLSEMTRAGATDWALGIEARCRALLSPDDAAEPLLREAIDRLERTHLRAEVARTRLLYGEQLRRTGRRGRARQELDVAHRHLSEMGLEGFAARAERELIAAGGTARSREPTAGAIDGLSPRELQVATLAREGLPNRDIGGRLYLSPRTVEYHLTRVFAKLGIAAREQLADLPLGEPREDWGPPRGPHGCDGSPAG